MAKTTLIHGDAADYAHLSADIMLTDPPFEMSGEALAGIINRYPVQHLLLLTVHGRIDRSEIAQLFLLLLAFLFLLPQCPEVRVQRCAALCVLYYILRA